MGAASGQDGWQGREAPRAPGVPGEALRPASCWGHPPVCELGPGAQNLTRARRKAERRVIVFALAHLPQCTVAACTGNQRQD